jgi:predicted O-methyltransferase YrrM
MHVGCVLIAYDVNGNREYLIDGYTGYLVPRKRTDIMAEYLIKLMKNQELKEKIRTKSLELISQNFTSRNKWPFLNNFLELGDSGEQTLSALKCSDLELLLGAPAYIADEEIPVFSRYVAKAKDTLVEIGAAYGASAVLMLVNAPSSAKIHSIDPFTTDSMGTFQASSEKCQKSVLRALKILKMPETINRWHLHTQPSYEAVCSWQGLIDFLYIDGSHIYEAVRKDFDDWYPFVKKGGYILLHDSRREENAQNEQYARGWPGPTKLAQELKKRNDLKLIEEVFSLTIWEKI